MARGQWSVWTHITEIIIVDGYEKNELPSIFHKNGEIHLAAAHHDKKRYKMFTESFVHELQLQGQGMTRANSTKVLSMSVSYNLG